MTKEERFPPGKWIKIDDERMLPLMKFAGVYAIYWKGKLHYIGRSNSNVGQRVRYQLLVGAAISAHMGKDRVTVKVRKNKRKFEHLTLEAQLIHKLQPSSNAQYPFIIGQKQDRHYVVPGATDRYSDEADIDFEGLVQKKIAKAKKGKTKRVISIHKATDL